LQPTDRPRATKAIRYAARRAVGYETLVIAHVLTPDSELIDGTLILPGEEAAVEAGEDILSNARRLADEAVGDESIDIETQLLTGRPADAITAMTTHTVPSKPVGRVTRVDDG